MKDDVNSNTTLVKVKLAWFIMSSLLITYSNTTLVKVKLLKPLNKNKS